MTMPKKGSRTIVVANKRYRYMIRKATDQSVCTIQEDTKKPGRVLTFAVEYGNEIKPSLIKDAIEIGLIKGWKPSVVGRAFNLDNMEN